MTQPTDRPRPDRPRRSTDGAPQRILVAVHDSPASLRAARLGITVARRYACPVLVVTVVRDGELTRTLSRWSSAPGTEQRRMDAATSIVRHVVAAATSAGVTAEVREMAGEPGPTILRAGEDWGADLLVLGRSEHVEPHPHLGDVALHVLELSDVPVLLVP